MVTKFKIRVEPKKIEELISEIQNGFVEYRLPSFQRDYVWDGDDVKNLIDSIVKNYPIGSIIVWKPSPKFKTKIKDMSEPIIYNKNSSDESYYIIDGQQRITSLLLMYNEWRIQRRNGKEIALRVPISYVSGKTGRFEKSSKRGTDISLVWKADRERERNPEELSEIKNKIGKENYEKILEIIKQISSYEVPVYIISTVNESEDVFKEMAEAFVRINKEGVRISNVQLMLSFLAGSIEGKLKNQIMELYNKYYESFGLELQVIIRIVLSNFEKANITQTQLSKINQIKSNINKISKFYDPDNSEEMIKRTDEAIKNTLKLIKEELNISDSRILPSQLTLIPIIKYFYIKGKNYILSNGEKRDIIKWFILANFKGRYSSATYTRLDQDLSLLKSRDKEIFKSLTSVLPRGSVINFEEIKKGKDYNLRKVQGRAFIFLLYILLIKNEAEDLSGHLIRSVEYRSLDKHHIFPQDFLENNLDVEDEDKKEILINNLGNIALIDELVNSEIGARDPREYLEEYEDKISKHFIPLDRSLWNINRYEDFINERLKLIYEGGKRLIPDLFS